MAPRNRKRKIIPSSSSTDLNLSKRTRIAETQPEADLSSSITDTHLDPPRVVQATTESQHNSNPIPSDLKPGEYLAEYIVKEIKRPARYLIRWAGADSKGRPYDDTWVSGPYSRAATCSLCVQQPRLLFAESI